MLSGRSRLDLAVKISIVTVAFNSGRTIGDTLRSVAGQSHPNIEHIVIDGGSIDDTLEQVQLHGTHVAYCRSEADAGIYDAMNKGLRLASGDFVGFLNADDILASPNAVATMARAMAKADVIYGDLVYVKADDTSRIVRRWTSDDYRPQRLRLGWMPPHPTFYVRRSCISAMAFDLRYRIAGDYDFMLRCLQLPGLRVSYLPEVLVHMRNGGASNRSIKALWRKSSEDLSAMRRNGVGGPFTLAAKNLRKLPQFFGS